MNRSDIRQAVFDQIDWQPDTSTDIINRLDRFVNRAYQQLALEAPFLFFEDKVHFATEIEVNSVSGTATDRLAVNSTDVRVLERPEGITGIANFPTDGSWDGREIEVTDPAGQVHRRTIRTTWSTGGGGLCRLSIDRPWPNSSDTGMTYRITTPRYFLPADVIEVQNMRLWSPLYRNPIHLKYRQEVQEDWQDDMQGQNSASTPVRAFRMGHFQLDAPTTAPVVTTTLTQAATWDGPDPAGEFQYCYTYAWGYRDAEFVSAMGTQEPKWESAPSPISTAKTAVYGGSALEVKTPDLNWMLGFGGASDPRYQKTGMRKRIYRRRNSIEGGANTRIESPPIYYFLTEVSAHVTAYTDTGATQVDIQRRLKTVHGYQSIQLSPMPDARYDVDIRCIRRPSPLDQDTDVARIHEEAMDVLIHKTLGLVYEAMGNPDMAAVSKGTYMSQLVTLSKRYGSLPHGRFTKKLARVR
jgi:hypothetical protein